MAGRRVCLFGGTFDPIHGAHLAMAEEAAAQFRLDRVVFIPAANPPHKEVSGLASYQDRLRMVQLACAGHPKFEVSDIEAGNDRSYTVKTLKRFRAGISEQDELFFLIGADAFSEIETWRRWQEVLRMVEFIVVSRPGNTYRVPPGAKLLRLDNVQLPTASTTVRAKLAAGEPTPEIPSEVRAYIDAHGLYRTAGAGCG